MAFHIGQKVVCIREEYDGGVDEFGNILPKYRDIYTIRGFLTDRYTTANGIWLEEIVNKPLPCMPDGKFVSECGFNIGHFRPIQTTKSLTKKAVTA